MQSQSIRFARPLVPFAKNLRSKQVATEEIGPLDMHLRARTCRGMKLFDSSWEKHRERLAISSEFLKC